MMAYSETIQRWLCCQTPPAKEEVAGFAVENLTTREFRFNMEQNDNSPTEVP